jgi:hypothetical protein
MSADARSRAVALIATVALLASLRGSSAAAEPDAEAEIEAYLMSVRRRGD